MRTISPAFAEYYYRLDNEPITVIEISMNDAGSEKFYLTSRADAVTIPGGFTVFDGWLSDQNGTSLEIQPERNSSTIGDYAFRVIDFDGSLTTLINDYDVMGMGLRHRVVRAYFGYVGMSWADIETNNVQTQIIDDLFIDGNEYDFKCSDIQRFERVDIFTPDVTTLSANMTPTQLLVPVYSVTGWEKMFHGPTFTDAVGDEVGYLQIDKEIIRWNDTTTDGTLGLCFVVDGATGRGALNTVPAEHKAETNSREGRGTEVSSVVYLEMPLIELMLGILTGSYYTEPGKSFPTKWNCGINSSLIRTSDFVGFGSDIWDISTPENSFIVRFVGEKETDAKQWLQEQCHALATSAPVVYSNGELGIERLTNVLAGSPYVARLDTSCVIKPSEVHLDEKSIRNLITIEWNWDHTRNKLTRQKILRDNTSIAKNKKTVPTKMAFRGLHGSRHTSTTLEGMFDRARDRFAGPPMIMTVVCQPWMMHLEVGDLVLGDLPSIKDPMTGGVLNRVFEVQRVAINWETGEVEFKLFASTAPAGPIAPEDPDEPGETPDDAVIPDAAYSALGVNLATYAGVTIVPSGGVGHITGGTGIVGGATFAAGRYYYLGDLQLDDGVDLPIFNNVELWVLGHNQTNGKYNGKGRGLTGAAALPWSDSDAVDEPLPAPGGLFDTKNLGTAGYIGPTVSGGGLKGVAPRTSYNSIAGYTVEGAVTTVPNFNIAFDAATNTITGIPDSMMGTSGSTGHNSMWEEDFFSGSSVETHSAGGAGGNGGASFKCISRGHSFGVNGDVDVSGGDGIRSTLYTYGNASGPSANGFDGGWGAGGAPGVALFIIDGLINDIPEIEQVTAKFGIGLGGPPPSVASSPVVAFSQDGLGESPRHSFYIGYGMTPPDMSGFGGAARAIFVPPVNTPTEDPPEEARPVLSISLSEATNTPPTPAGTLSSIEVLITPPADDNYSYAKIYYRVVGQESWQYGTAADDEGVVVVPSDGTTYEFEARSITVNAVESGHGVRATITVTDLINDHPDDDQVPVVLVVPNVTGLEIAGQGNNTDFTGPNVTVAWRRSSDREWLDPITGRPAGSGPQDQYFSHYQVLVYDADNGEILREAVRTTPQFTYDLAMNEEDSNRADVTHYRSLAGPRRELLFEVYQWSRQNRSSQRPAKITVRNPAPDNITGVNIVEGAYSAKFSYNRPTDADFAGMEVWLDTTPSFTPDDLNRILQGADSALTIVGLQSGINYYLRYRPYDAFGPGEMSDELVFSTAAIVVDPEDLGLGPWATAVDPVDLAFINANIAGDAIDSTKIANLTAAKITTGVLIATLTIQTTGSIRVTQGVYETRIGVHNASGIDYAIRTYDGATSPFSVTAAGILNATGASISGNITIIGGSGFGNFSDKPADYYMLNQYSSGALFTDDIGVVGAELHWQNYNGSAELGRVGVSDASGGWILRVGNNSGNDMFWGAHKKLTAVDPNKLYEIRFRARQTAGTGVCYFGLMGVASDDVTLVNATGVNTYSSQHYIAGAAVTVPSSWTEYIGYFKGSAATGDTVAHSDPLSPAALHTNVRSVRPLFIANYSALAGTVEIDFAIIREITLDASGRPTALSYSGDLNATLGANWSTNLTSRPTELTDGRVATGLNSSGRVASVIRGADLTGTAATGLNMSSTRLGYYDGSAWKVYIANDGTFLFQGNASNFVQWNGTTLTLQGTLVIQSGSGYANLTDRPNDLGDINSTEGTKLTGIATGATKNVIYRQASAPSSPVDGDIWVDTDATPRTVSLRVSGAWQADADATNNVLTVGTTITGGGITMSAGGSVKGGKTTPGSGTGFFLGYSSSVYQLDVGDTTAGKYIRFNGTDLTLGENTKIQSVQSITSDDLYFQEQLNTTGAGYTVNTSSGGSVTFGSTGLITFACNGSHGAADDDLARAEKIWNTGIFTQHSWDKVRFFRFVLRPSATFNSQNEFFAGLGTELPSSTTSYSAGFVVKFVSSQLRIYAHNSGGSGETQTIWGTVLSVGSNYSCYLAFYPGDRAEFYINETLIATHTTNLPTGLSDATRAPFFNLAATASGGAANISIGEWRYLQKE